jgi:hypothetical protein
VGQVHSQFIRKAGWDDLAADFKVKHLLETGVMRFDEEATWYI